MMHWCMLADHHHSVNFDRGQGLSVASMQGLESESGELTVRADVVDKRKILAVVGALVFGAIGVGLLIAYVNEAEDRAQADA